MPRGGGSCRPSIQNACFFKTHDYSNSGYCIIASYNMKYDTLPSSLSLIAENSIDPILSLIHISEPTRPY